MAVVGIVRECVAATSSHHFDISGGFSGSLVGEIPICLYLQQIPKDRVSLG
jgi:hypothetical protein